MNTGRNACVPICTSMHAPLQDRRDPGYWSTSRMILEAGLCMVLDANKLSALAAAGQTQGSLGVRAGGVLTPASALGMVMVDRLRAAGFTWAVEETKTCKQSM